MKKTNLLLLGGIINIWLAILHVPLLTSDIVLKEIGGGWGLILYEAQSPFLYLLGLTIILALAVSGLYAFSCLGVIRKLPLIKTVLVSTGIIYFFNSLELLSFIKDIAGVGSENSIRWPKLFIGSVSLMLSMMYLVCPIYSLIRHKSVFSFIKEKNICDSDTAFNKKVAVMTMYVFVIFFLYYLFILGNSFIKEKNQSVFHLKQAEYTWNEKTHIIGFSYGIISHLLKDFDDQVSYTIHSRPELSGICFEKTVISAYVAQVDNKYWTSVNHKISLGTTRTDFDQTAVISTFVKEKLFHKQNPLKKTIQVGKVDYLVIGVIENIPEVKNQVDVWTYNKELLSKRADNGNAFSGDFMLTVKVAQDVRADIIKSGIRKKLKDFYRTNRKFQNISFYLETKEEEVLRVKFGIKQYPSPIDALLAVFNFLPKPEKVQKSD